MFGKSILKWTSVLVGCFLLGRWFYIFFDFEVKQVCHGGRAQSSIELKLLK